MSGSKVFDDGELTPQEMAKRDQEAHDLATGFCLITAHLNLYTGLIMKNKAQVAHALTVTGQLLKANPEFAQRHKEQSAAFLESAKEQMAQNEKALIIPDGKAGPYEVP